MPTTSNTNGSNSAWMLGINLSGAEYGDPSTGRMYWNYIYPTNQELDHYSSEGATVVRIPISLERMMPTAGGNLDPTQMAYLDALVAHAAADGLKVILDPHNYGYAYGTEIGTTAASNANFANFWSKLAGHYASTSNVIFGLMNEPHDQTAQQWLTPANMAIAAIRAAGATTQEILVPGTAWDSGINWMVSGSASVLGPGIVDPNNNYAFEVHQYFDSDSSGTHDSVVSATVGVQRLTAVTQWAEATGHKLFLGEFGVANNALSLQALSTTLTYLQQHADVWQGGTYWASGPWMGSYMFSAENATGGDNPQMTILRQFMSLPATAVAATTNTTQSVTQTVAQIVAQTVTPTAQTTTATTIPTTTATATTIAPTTVSQNNVAAAPVAVYRFFDSVNGTQFLTASSDEVKTIQASNPNLTYEGLAMNGFASNANDPNAVPVYRFFNTGNGTHFFTSSGSEANQIAATRPDLVAEQGNFYEHSTQAAGDTAVYRFFNAQTGDHFFTSSATERASIDLTRADMVDEGIAFYTPSLA